MINEILIDNKIYKLECIWRTHKKDKTKDYKGTKFPYPKTGLGWSDCKYFANRLKDVQKYLDEKKAPKKYILEECLNCKLCDLKCVTSKRYFHNDFFWEDGLEHYITQHKIKPSDEFIKMIYNVSMIPINMTGRIKKKENEKYIKLDTNQLMILDALLRHGGYTKKYFDTKYKDTYRYSEHAGLLDIHDSGLERIIVSGNTNRVDRGDEEIYLPNDSEDIYDFEYIFHTHPPTPKPGGRAKDGILYEFPSMGDIFHFIDHFNDGKTIGSLVMTSEGLYNIRKLDHTKNKIIIDEDKFYDDIKKQFRNQQEQALKKYGTKFSTYEFYSKISQDTSFIETINKTLEKYEIAIDYYPRQKDNKGTWQISSLYLRML